MSFRTDIQNHKAYVAEVEPAYYLQTGILSLDYALGNGGLAAGSIAEFFGRSQSGKTTGAVYAAKSAIKRGGVLYLDLEGTFDATYAKTLGLDVSHPNFALASPASLEQVANMTLDAVEGGKCRLVIMDSLAAAAAEAELDKDVGSSHVAVRARLMSVFVRKLIPALKANNCIFIVINHEQDKIDAAAARFGLKLTTTPGGEALKFYATYRVKFKVIGSTKKKVDRLDGESYDQIQAARIEVHVEKNKRATPYRKQAFYLFLGVGVSNIATLLDIAIANKLVVNTGSIFKFDKPHFSIPKNARGLDATLTLLAGSGPYRGELRKAVEGVMPELFGGKSKAELNVAVDIVDEQPVEQPQVEQLSSQGVSTEELAVLLEDVADVLVTDVESEEVSAEIISTEDIQEEELEESFAD